MYASQSCVWGILADVHTVCKDSWAWRYIFHIHIFCSDAYSQDTCNLLYALTCSYVPYLYDCIHVGGAYSCYMSFQSFTCCSLYLYLKLWCMLSSITKNGEIESTSAPWVILAINVNISLVGLIFSSSIFQISSTLKWHGQEDVEPLQDAKDKHWQKLKALHFHF